MTVVCIFVSAFVLSSVTRLVTPTVAVWMQNVSAEWFESYLINRKQEVQIIQNQQHKSSTGEH
jgi:hypothetical protein